MHVPAYAHATIRAVLPSAPTADQLRGLNCGLCDMPFGDRVLVSLNTVAESDLKACRPCLTRLVARARQLRDAALTEEASTVQAELAAWAVAREQYLATMGRVRQAAEAVTRLVDDSGVAPLRAAWLHVSLESAHAWATDDKPEPPRAVDSADGSVHEAEVGLFIAMTLAREAVADRLAYHLISEDSPPEPEICADLECPPDCSGKHETSGIDCGPDAIFKDLSGHGISLESWPYYPAGESTETTP